MTARAVRPRNTDPIAFLQVCNTRAERDNDSRYLMSGRDRKIGFTGQSPCGALQVSVADSTRDDFHQGRIYNDPADLLWHLDELGVRREG